MFPVPQNKSFLSILWADGASSTNALARALAGTRAQSQDIGGRAFLLAHFGQSEFVIAAKLFEIVGGRKTTQAAANGYAIVNKAKLREVFACFLGSLNSKSRAYCEVDLGRERTSAADLTISLTVLGIAVNQAGALTTPVRHVHPCKTCFYATQPAPKGPEAWQRSVEEFAGLSHAKLCPRFQSEIKPCPSPAAES